MKIGIIADIHANPYGLDAVIQRLQSCEVILCAGDITGYNTSVNEVFDILEEHNVIFIRGNHDEWLLRGYVGLFGSILGSSIEYTKETISEDNLAKLRRAPIFYTGQFGGLTIRMYHGSPWEPLRQYIDPDYMPFEKFEEIDADLIILGHTHIPFIRENVVNPGSCGISRDNDPRASYAFFETDTSEITLGRVEYDMKQERIS